MKKTLLFIIALAMVFTSCNRDDSHIIVPENPDNIQGGVVVGFNTDNLINKKFGDTHIYGFDASGKMILHNYYSTQKELANDIFKIENGAYTFIAILNVGEAFTPGTRANAQLQNVTMNELMGYIKRSEANYPDMLTGMMNRTITSGNMERIEMPLYDKSGGIENVTTVISVTITLPDAEFITYQNARTKATADYNLRGVIEFYQKGTTEPIHHASAILTPTATEGTYTLTTEVFDGQYDMVLWVDYTANGSETDLWYDTKKLQALKIISTDKSYTFGSDSREVFYYTGEIEVMGGEMATNITTDRPQAKYTLISDDIIRYNELMAANPDKYVPISDLAVSIIYEGYLPCGFNALTGKPNDSDVGYKCTNTLPLVVQTDTELEIGGDYVLVNGDESSVVVTVFVTDKAGRIVSRVQGITVQYKRNMLTTIKGDFLTAGVINPGININTDWDDVYNVEF